MALVSTSIPNLLNGVSQQPAPLRQTTQGEEQTNALSSVIDGLIKRPPTEHLAELLASTVSNAAIHVAETVDGVHIFVATNEPNHPNAGGNADFVVVRVFKEDGTERNINPAITTNQAIYAYLKTTNPADDLKFLTVGADTYILNRSVKVTKTGVVSTPSSGASVNTFSDLPDGEAEADGGTGSASIGHHYRVLNGGSTTSTSDFYVKALTTKTYEESFKPGENYGPASTTMPHLLTLTEDTGVGGGYYYSLSSITWGKRTVGDVDSAPNPSFLSSSATLNLKKLNNIFFYKNRLGFLCEDNVIFSAAGDFYRFFPKTVRSVLDDGPIDVKVAHTKANTLMQAVTFNDSLTLFSDHTQFTIENAGALTPRTISIVASTEFDNDSGVSPVGAGNYLYFSSKKGDYSSVREYSIEADTLISAAQDITAHVPKYVPKNIVKLATSSNEDILACLSSDDRSKLYIYKWYTDGPQKLQSSWSTWQLPAGSSVLDITVIESSLYLIVSRTGSTSLEKVDLQYLDDSGLQYCVRADRKVTVTGAYVAGTNKTTWTLPYSQSGDIHLVKGGTWPTQKGANITNTRPSNTTVEATGDFSAYPCILGVPYTMSYKFSHQYVKEKNGASSIQSGRLQMRTMSVNFENTGFFKINVTPLARTTYEYQYTGVTLNQAGSIIGEVILNDGAFRFPLQSKNDQLSIEITSDSFLPCAFQSAEWEGFYNIRSKRI